MAETNAYSSVSPSGASGSIPSFGGGIVSTRGGIMSEDWSQLYFIGFVDLLEAYSWRWGLQRAALRLVCKDTMQVGLTHTLSITLFSAHPLQCTPLQCTPSPVHTLSITLSITLSSAHPSSAHPLHHPLHHPLQ
jgi:hypothetical protein